ncbi:MAG: hypothetical protein ACE5F1_01555 [Planctomycetota bacterium]
MTEQDMPHGEAGRDPGIPSLDSRVRDLTDQIGEHTRIRTTRQRRTMVLGVVLSVACILSLSAVTSLSRKLDADTVAQLGRIELERHLPSGRVRLQSHLEQEAPRLVSGALHSLLDMLPSLRRYLLRDMNRRMDDLNREFELRTVSLMEMEVLKSKAEIDRAFPNLGDRAKLEKLVEAVAKDFNGTFASITRELYPSYQLEMRRITKYLADLKSRSPDSLSREETLKKEIIQTLLHVIEREREQR